jgi:hypothetical protein
MAATGTGPFSGLMRKCCSSVCSGSVSVTRGGSGQRGIQPKLFCASASTCSPVTSPTTTSVQLLGT